MKDPAFLSDAGKIGIEISPLPGEDVQQIIEEVVHAPSSVRKAFLKAAER